MLQADWHMYQVLTKRSSRMRDLLKNRLRMAAARPHIWWGVSVENKKNGLPPIKDLRAAPAAMKFLSIDSLLEDLGEINLAGIDWVIVGGESEAGGADVGTGLYGFAASVGGTTVRFLKRWGSVRGRKTRRVARRADLGRDAGGKLARSPTNWSR